LRDAFDGPGVQLLFIVSSHTGIRASELKRIKWQQVDFMRKIIMLERGKTKNKDPRSAPIYGDMVQHLTASKEQRDEFYPACQWVFSRAGSPIKSFKGEWDKAVKKAGVPELHFHDLRRTAQRLMRRAGIDRITRMRIMGHKTDAMDIRYGVVEDNDIVEAGVKLEATFRDVLGDRSSGALSNSPSAAGHSDSVAKLAALPEEKLQALIALLGIETPPS
jgi:integrase